jgi:hypothetical protein
MGLRRGLAGPKDKGGRAYRTASRITPNISGVISVARARELRLSPRPALADVGDEQLHLAVSRT